MLKQIKTYTLNNQVLTYTLEYKDMKNIRARIKKDELIISCPYTCPFSLIEKFIKDHFDDLYQCIHSYTYHFDIKEGGYIDIFGIRRKIHFRKEKNIILKDEDIYMPDNLKALNRYLFELLKEYIKERYTYYLELDSRFKVTKISYKKYKSCWGKCYPKRKELLFNTELIFQDKHFIDYVIVHECCHLIYPNHSKEFYKEVEKYIKDYKQIRKEGTL